MSRIAAWLAGALGAMVLGDVIVIVAFDYYEPGFGRFGTLQIALMIGVALGAIGGLGYGVTSFVRRAFQTPRRALLAGVLFQVCLFAAIEGIKYGASSFNSLFTAALLAAVLGVASSFLFIDHVA